jgi:hypothetical protein
MFQKFMDTKMNINNANISRKKLKGKVVPVLN